VSLTVQFFTPDRSVDILPWFDPVPTNQFVEFGDPFSYDIDAKDNLAVDDFKVNDSRFSIDSDGLLQNNTHLPVAVYTINITVNDTWGNENSTLIDVNVSDTTPPTIIDIYNITEQLGIPLSRQFNATDLSGVKNWTVNDTGYFSISDNGLLTNATNLIAAGVIHRDV